MLYWTLLPLLLQPPAPPAQPPTLQQTVEALDARLFQASYACDLKTLAVMVADDLEFYHDQTGLSVGKEAFLKATRDNLCGKVQRTAVPGSMEVQPLTGYGAVQLGTHRLRQPARPDQGVGEARYVHLWQNRDGVWKLTRVISFDHHPAAR